MSDVFISYARSTAAQAQAAARALRARGYSVWIDDELPTHRAYSDVIEEELASAKALLVIWSAEAVKSQWVKSEADRARHDAKLVQMTVDRRWLLLGNVLQDFLDNVHGDCKWSHFARLRGSHHWRHQAIAEHCARKGRGQPRRRRSP